MPVQAPLSENENDNKVEINRYKVAFNRTYGVVKRTKYAYINKLN